MLNVNYILQLVSHYVRNKQLTYDDFELTFPFLTQMEKYKVVEVLEQNEIELVDEYTGVGTLDEQTFFIGDDEIDSFDDDSFVRDEDCNESGVQEATIVRTSVAQSNILLLSEIQNGNKQALQDFCIKNKRLVDKYAKGYRSMLGNKLEFDDLEQAGMLGMIKAAYKYDFRGEFSTYAVYWIKQSIVREIMDHGFTIRIPVHTMEQIVKVGRIDAEYMDIEDYNERIKKIADELGISAEDVNKILSLRSMYLSTVSLDVPIGEDQDTSLIEMIPIEDEVSVEDQVGFIMLRADLKKALSTLTEREQKIIRSRFGLDDGRSSTLEEIGREYGITRERVRQIENKALTKLKRPCRINGLEEFLK